MCAIIGAFAGLLLHAAAPPSRDLFDEIYVRGRGIERSLKTVTAGFTETTTSSLLSRPLVARGTLAVERPSKIVLRYTEPEPRTVLIDQNRLTLVWPSHAVHQETDIAAAQRRIEKYFLDKSPDELRRNFTITATESAERAGTWRVTMVPTRKQIQQGLTQLDLWIDRTSLLLAAMQSTPVVRSLAVHRLLAGGSLGLALLAKGTSYLHALPFLVWFVWSQARRDVAGLLRILTVMAVMAGIINAGFLLRNVQLFSSLFGPGGEEECEYCGLANETITAPIFASNVLRNIGTNLGTPSAGVNEYMTVAITAAHRAMGISTNDQRSTWWKGSFFVVRPQFDENSEGNLVHLLLILGTIGLLFLKRKELGLVKPYVISLTGAFLLMSLLLKWGPSQSRYQLGLFVLWAPVIGWAFERLRQPVVANLMVAGLFVLAMPWLLLNSNRPLIGDRTIWNTPSEEQLFMSRFTRPYLAMFADAAALLRREHCSKVGVIRRQTDFEYPLWVMLRKQPGETLRLEEMLVENVSKAAAAPHESQEFRPCAIVTISYSNVTNVSLVKPDDSVFQQPR